ncbi:MAG: GMC family oxidoreductase [Solirubrobacteraceae bacterium]
MSKAASDGFDYVIVGAGSAGCVLAARLSEDPDIRVALLEAGGEDTAPEIRIPAIFPIMFKTELDWDLFGDPEPGMDGRRLYLPRGRMLGGCSSINAMIYVRGNRLDYDAWEAAGCEGWGYDEVLPYFKRSEDNERGESQFHGAGGPLTVSESRSMHPLVDAMIAAANEAGHELNPDFNGARQEGVGRFQLTQRDGRRLSTSDAFLHPVRSRPNLTVITHAFAHRVLFDGDRATRVQYSRLDDVVEIRAVREVIVCAGAYHSPQLLMLSGIGPEQMLAPMGIEVRENLPVGENLQDHCMCNLNYTTTGPSLFDAVAPENFALFESEGRGPLTSNIPEGAGFFRSRPGLDAPDVEFHFAPGMLYDGGLTAPEAPGMAYGPVVVKPTGRGRVMLRSPMPLAKPRVLCNFLTTEEDRATMVAGLRMALEMAQQPALRELIDRPFRVPDSDSEADLLAFARREGMTVFHPTSTCAMGSVVDHELRVLGIDGLRVADASVMPEITRANTNAPTIMIAERAAELIRAGGAAPAISATA